VINLNNENVKIKKEKEEVKKYAENTQNKVKSLRNKLKKVKKESMEKQIELARGKESVILLCNNMNKQNISNSEKINKENLGLSLDVKRLNEKVKKIGKSRNLLKEKLIENNKLLTNINNQLEVEKKENILLEIGLEDRNFLKEKNKKLEAKLDSVRIELDLSSDKVKEESKLKEEAVKQAELLKELSQKTVDFINYRLNEQREENEHLKNSLSKKDKLIAKVVSENNEDKQKLSKERGKFEKDTETLLKEQNILEELKEEANKIIENTIKANYEEKIANAKSEERIIKEIQNLKNEIVRMEEISSKMRNIQHDVNLESIKTKIRKKNIKENQAIQNNVKLIHEGFPVS
jgi:hypothetical protein